MILKEMDYGFSLDLTTIVPYKEAISIEFSRFLRSTESKIYKLFTIRIHIHIVLYAQFFIIDATLAQTVPQFELFLVKIRLYIPFHLGFTSGIGISSI